MARARIARRLVADDCVYFWSLRHQHLPHQLTNRQCREVLGIRREGERGRLEIVFCSGPDHAVGDSCHSGQVGVPGGGWLNLHMPGVVRALLDQALEHGWRANEPTLHRLDGWKFVEAVAGKVGNAAQLETRR